MRYFRGLITGMALLEMAMASSYGYEVTFNPGEHGVIISGDINQSVDQNDSAVEPVVVPYFREYTFVGWDKTFSTISADVEINAVYSKNISLEPGKHLLSLNLDMATNDLRSLAERSFGPKSYLKDTAGQIVRNVNGRWINSIGMWNSSEGYYASLDQSATFSAIGTSADFSTGIPLKHGYSIVPFVHDVSMKLEEYFASALDSIIFIKDISNNLYSTGNTGGITDLQPGRSYLVKTHESSRLILPKIIRKAIGIDIFNKVEMHLDLSEYFPKTNVSYQISSANELGIPDLTINDNGIISIPPSIAIGNYLVRVCGDDENAPLFLLLSISEEYPVDSTSSIVVTIDSEDDDTAVTEGRPVNDVVAEIGMDGLSFREAVWIAERFDTIRTITFLDTIETVSLASDLIITTDLIIRGNGADKTTLAVGNNWLKVIQGSGDGNANDSNDVIDFSVLGLTLTGGSTTHSILYILGDLADKSNLIIKSSVFSDHLNNGWTWDDADFGYGGAIRTEHVDVTIENSTFSNLSGRRGVALCLIDSSSKISGVTFDRIVVNQDWGSIIHGREGEGSHELSYGTFFNCSSAVAPSFYTSGFSLANVVQSGCSGFDSSSFIADTTLEDDNGQPATSTRNGTWFYRDITSGSGADDFMKNGYYLDKEPISFSALDTDQANSSSYSDQGSSLLLYDSAEAEITVPNLHLGAASTFVEVKDDHGNIYTIMITIDFATGSYSVTNIDQLADGIIANGVLQFLVDGALRQLKITVVGDNDAPVRNGDSSSYMINAKSSRTIDLSKYFDDPDNDPLTYSLVNTSNGSDISFDNGILSTGTTNSGVYTITFTASDGHKTITDSINVTVLEPAISEVDNSNNSVKDEVDRIATGSAVITDGEFAAASEQGQPACGTVEYTITGNTLYWTYTLDYSNPSVNALDKNETKSDSFVIRSIRNDEYEVSVSVTGINDSPSLKLTPLSISGLIGGTVIFDPALYFSDIDGDSLTYALVFKNNQENIASGITYEKEAGHISIAESVAPGEYFVSMSAEDQNGGKTDVTFRLELSTPTIPDDFEERLFITVTTGDEDDDSIGYSYSEKTFSQMIAELGADGLSLREAIFIADINDGVEYIIFDSSVTTAFIEKDLTISSDINIVGNGADKTTLQFAYDPDNDGILNKYINIEITADNSHLTTSIRGLTIRGSGDAVTSTAMLHVNGQKIDDDTAYFANVTFESVEFLAHTTNQSEALIKGSFAGITMKNVYIADIHANSRNIAFLSYSDLNILGMTVKGLTTESGNWKSLISVENENVIGADNMSDYFRQALSFSIRSSTFTGNQVGNGSNCYLILFTTENSSSEYLRLEDVVYAGNEYGTQGVYYRQGGLLSEFRTVHYADALEGPALVRSGVHYYQDNSESGGADEINYYNAPTVESDIRSKYVFLKDGSTIGDFHIMNQLNPLFVDLDYNHLYIKSTYTGAGIFPDGYISISTGGHVTVAADTPQGVYTYSLRADDDHGGIAFADFAVYVSVEGAPNTSPEYVPVNNNDLYVVNVQPESDELTYVNVADWFDRQGDLFELRATLNGGATLPEWGNLNDKGVFIVDESLVPTDGGIFSLQLTATEMTADALNNTYNFDLALNHIPVAEEPSIPINTSIVIDVDDGSFSTIDISEYFSDSDNGDSLSFSVSNLSGGDITGLTINNSGVIRVDESLISVGEIKCRVTALDKYGAAASINISFYAEGNVLRTLEAGIALATEQFFAHLADLPAKEYRLQLVADGVLSDTLPATISIDKATGAISSGYRVQLEPFVFYVSRIDSDDRILSRKITISYIQSTQVLTIDDAYVGRVGGSVSAALIQAVEEASEGHTIIFKLSESLVNVSSIPTGYNSDFDGDGDKDLYISLSDNILIDKSLTIEFDMDDTACDRDIILVGGGLSIEGHTNNIQVYLSEFAVLGAPIAAISQNGGSVTVKDADLADGKVAYYVEYNDMTSTYDNYSYLINTNIYGNNTTNAGMLWDQATVYARNVDRFEMRNVFVGGNTFTYGLFAVSGSSDLSNVTIANNSRVGTTRGRFINGGVWSETTIVDNNISSFINWQSDIMIPIFIYGSFRNSLIAGNIMGYWIDDPVATPDSVQDGYRDDFNITVNGSLNSMTDNILTIGQELIGSENSDVYLGSNNRQFIIVDGVIHYVDNQQTGADLLDQYLIKYSGTTQLTDLTATLLQARSNGYNNSLVREVLP